MSLVTPDLGLLFWMVLIFGAVFFLLAKFGFPVITDMVEKRTEGIDRALKDAAEAEDRLKNLAREQEKLLDEARKQQSIIIKEATKTKEQIIARAKEDASSEAAKIVEHAKAEIAAEKQTALADLRRQVALMSLEIAQKVLREKLSTDKQQLEYIDRLSEEISSENHQNTKA